MSSLDIEIPTLDLIRDARKRLGEKIVTTPVWQWRGQEKNRLFGEKTELFIKLETFQYGGCFKPRGALLNIMALNSAQLKHGVTAISAGNHAIAVAYAASILKTSAKVVIPKNANPFRVQRCISFGAEVIYCRQFKSEVQH